jgi:competence protein ComEC
MSNILGLRLLKKLDLTSLLDDCHVEVYAWVCFILGFEYPIAWAFLIVYVFWLKRHMRFHLLIVLMIVGFLGIQWIEQKTPEMIFDRATVVDIEQMTYGHRVTVKVDHRKYHMYAYQEVKLGEVYFIKAHVEPYRNQTVPKGFDANQYYRSQGIYGKLSIEEMTWIESRFHLYELRMKWIEKVSVFKSQSMVMSMVFGETGFDESLEETYRFLGIMYLFSMSGLHIYVLIGFLKRLMFHLNLSDMIQKACILLLLFSMLYLYQGSYVILRILLMKLLDEISRKYQLELTGLDRIQIVFISMIIMDFHLLVHQGFWILYLIINIIHVTEFLYRHLDIYSKKITMTSIVQMTILPFTRLFSPMMLPLFPFIQLFMSYVIAPLSIAVLFFPFLDSYFYQIIEMINPLFGLLSNRNLSLTLPVLSSVWVSLYLLGLMMLFRSKDWIGRTWKAIFILCLFYIPSIQIHQDQVVFLDVGQGDAIYIQSQGCTMMIDAYQGAYQYLIHHGIRHLDILLLTHSDIDHTHDAKKIIDSIQVDRLILSAYDDDLGYQYPKTMFVKSEDKLACGEILIDVLGPIRDYNSQNDNSIVIQMVLREMTFLFTGDIELEAEKDLVDRYGSQLSSDILKIGHHGSITSSSESFIQHVNPKFAVISVGHQNRFGFPDDKVISRLMKQDVSIFRTDRQGTIICSLNQKSVKWKIHLPYQH